MYSRTAIAILAGGHGLRLWPLSRPERPKQFVPIFPEGSVLQSTFAWARRLRDPADILVVGNREHRHLYLEQLPELDEQNLILEPDVLGTAPCIGLTAALEAGRDRFDVIVTIPVDHVVVDFDEWAAVIETAGTHAAEHEHLVSIGAKPQAPDTKFGYIVVSDRVGGTDRHPISNVVRFVEKPDRQTLESLIASGRCLRNLGMVAFRPEILLEELQAHVPAIGIELLRAGEHGFEEASIERAYASMPNISIDVALLQETDRLVAATSGIRSIDAGDFASLGEALEADEDGNAVRGKAAAIDAASNTVLSEEAFVAVLGVRDLVIVVDDKTILVCPKDKTQRIREASKQ